MNEKVLQFIWKYQLFSNNCLKTTQQEPLVILNAGLVNEHAGPDFFTASIRINNQLWVGNVEIHQKSSDWYLHNHHIDEHYKAVILHVVWEYDSDVFNPHQQIIPTLELSKFVKPDFLKRYTDFIAMQPKWILCENQLKNIPKFTIQNWFEVLFIERLERKSVEINQLLLCYKNDWERVLFVLLAKNFGAKINSESFMQLAQSIEYHIIRKEKNSLLVIESLLFGQAGFLSQDLEDAYYQKLQKEYQFLATKYGLKPLEAGIFNFFRLRPLNFPTIRLAQFAGLNYATQFLFSKLMETQSKEEIYTVLKKTTSVYWDTHYTFGKTSKMFPKNMAKDFMDGLIINTIIPLKFAYIHQKGTDDIALLMELISAVKPEKNAIAHQFSQFGITACNAVQTQAMLQLKNEYCNKNRCLDCSIGNEILRKLT